MKKTLVFAAFAAAVCLMTVGSPQKAIADPPVTCWILGCPDWCIGQDNSCKGDNVRLNRLKSSAQQLDGVVDQRRHLNARQ